jgi:predicted nuclease of predicted toxin-antitoxin system
LKFKVDENLPTEYTLSILRGAGFEADTVSDGKLSGASDSVLCEGCRTEDRVLMTLDLDFVNVQGYPPKCHPGIVVFRPESQDKPTLVALLKRLFPVLPQLSPKHQLWIVEPDRIRYREE